MLPHRIADLKKKCLKHVITMSVCTIHLQLKLHNLILNMFMNIDRLKKLTCIFLTDMILILQINEIIKILTIPVLKIQIRL